MKSSVYIYIIYYLEIHPDWRPLPQQQQIRTLSLFYPSEPSWLFPGRIRSRSWRCKPLLPPPCSGRSRTELQQSGRSSYIDTQPHKWHVMSKLPLFIFIEVFHSFNKEAETCHIEAFSRVSVDKLEYEAQQDLCKGSWGKLDMLWSTCFEFTFKLSEVWHRSVSVMLMDYWVWKQWYRQVTPIVTKLWKQYYVFLYIQWCIGPRRLFLYRHRFCVLLNIFDKIHWTSNTKNTFNSQLQHGSWSSYSDLLVIVEVRHRQAAAEVWPYLFPWDRRPWVKQILFSYKDHWTFEIVSGSPRHHSVLGAIQ